jgi:hypothetical protein
MKVMIKTEFPITNQFLDLKQMFKSDNIDVEAFDHLSGQLLVHLSELTENGMKGDDVIEGIKLDLWKDRVWHLIERVGLLPEYKDEDGDELIEALERDDWYEDDSKEFDVEEKEPKKGMDLSFDPFYGF